MPYFAFHPLNLIIDSLKLMLMYIQEKYEDTIRECTKALELNPKYMKALVKRGEAYEKCEKLEEAIVGKT